MTTINLVAEQSARVEAEALTQQLKTNVNDLSKLIKKAHDGRIWEALGYNSFSVWVREELGWSHTRGFQLLNIASVTEDLTKAMKLPEGFELSDNETRLIISRGRTEFIDSLKTSASEDPEENLKLLMDELAELEADEWGLEENETEDTKDEPPAKTAKTTTTAPEVDYKVKGGVRNTDTLFVISRSMRRQTQNFPDPTQLKKPEIQRGMKLLIEAHKRIETLITELTAEQEALSSEVDKGRAISEEMRTQLDGGWEK